LQAQKKLQANAFFAGKRFFFAGKRFFLQANPFFAGNAFHKKK
jgi:hypothetical protein